jgi:hypothetical protein
MWIFRWKSQVVLYIRLTAAAPGAGDDVTMVTVAGEEVLYLLDPIPPRRLLSHPSPPSPTDIDRV